MKKDIIYEGDLVILLKNPRFISKDELDAGIKIGAIGHVVMVMPTKSDPMCYKIRFNNIERLIAAKDISYYNESNYKKTI